MTNTTNIGYQETSTSAGTNAVADRGPAATGTLVLGGTGKTGRRVAARLTELGVPVRVGSRSGTPPFNWDEPATWPAAVDGMGAVYLVYYPDLAFPGAADTVRAFADLAVGQGVRRLVLLSGRGEEEAVISERGVRDSGAEWTIVRASMFSQNFSEDFLVEAVRYGEIALPAGTVREPFLDADDIADVVVVALTSDGHVGATYELTGPRLLTFAAAAADISAAVGREVQYRPVTSEEFAALLAGEGMPTEFVTLLTDLFTKILDGRNAHLTDGVERVLGRRPREFAEYARAAAATGAWDLAQPNE